MRHRCALCIALFSAIACGCSSVAYDACADQQLDVLTHDINAGLIAWRIEAQDGGKVPYDATFYSKVEAELTELRIRMTALEGPSTRAIESIFDSLEKQIDALRQLHRQQNTLDAFFLDAELRLLDTQLALLNAYELALKNGAATDSLQTTH
jgi:hypothetical protein